MIYRQSNIYEFICTPQNMVPTLVSMLQCIYGCYKLTLTMLFNVGHALKSQCKDTLRFVNIFMKETKCYCQDTEENCLINTT
jgi:hypothetical protein